MAINELLDICVTNPDTAVAVTLSSEVGGVATEWQGVGQLDIYSETDEEDGGSVVSTTQRFATNDRGSELFNMVELGDSATLTSGDTTYNVTKAIREGDLTALVLRVSDV